VATLSTDNMLRLGSVILTSKRPLGLVVGGFFILLIVILKVYSGLIPVKGGLIPMTTLTPLVTKAK
jgi:hypothetical protein